LCRIVVTRQAENK